MHAVNKVSRYFLGDIITTRNSSISHFNFPTLFFVSFKIRQMNTDESRSNNKNWYAHNIIEIVSCIRHELTQ